VPANAPFDQKDLEKRMDGALAALKIEFQGLRTGRANAHLLDPVMVDAYGSMTPLNQVGAVSAPEPRMLTVQIWDRGVVTAVEKAIRSAGLGVNPIVDGQTIRVPIPPLNEERRKELAKLAAKYSEAAKVAVRNVRRDGMDHLKKLEKDGDISEDQRKKNETLVQTATDKFVKMIDDALKTKEEEIMQV
jgi:ribosome recycling factor